MDFVEGQITIHPYPFYKGTTPFSDEDMAVEIPTWIPGVIRQSEDSPGIAHGIGLQRFLCIRIVTLPSPYGPRVFYMQKWVDPQGKVFGSTRLRMTTLRNYRSLTNGFRFPYIVKDSTNGLA